MTNSTVTLLISAAICFTTTLICFCKDTDNASYLVSLTSLFVVFGVIIFKLGASLG